MSALGKSVRSSVMSFSGSCVLKSTSTNNTRGCSSSSSRKSASFETLCSSKPTSAKISPRLSIKRAWGSITWTLTLAANCRLFNDTAISPLFQITCALRGDHGLFRGRFAAGGELISAIVLTARHDAVQHEAQHVTHAHLGETAHCFL